MKEPNDSQNIHDAFELLSSAYDRLDGITYEDPTQDNIPHRIETAMTEIKYAMGFLNNERAGV